MTSTDEHLWPHHAALAEIRGSRSVESVARQLGVNRVTWFKWEAGTQVPKHDNLRDIVEVFGVPPETVGYNPPKGWELVPAQWIRDIDARIDAKLDQILAALDPDTADSLAALLLDGQAR
jgi:transcriptional regulator with XRE-family HTH domain